jgi:phosphoribosylformylglycinamidine synthase
VTRYAVVVFPGTNCEHDVASALESVGLSAELVWHGATSLGGVDGVVLPGGFAHGDYLRPGAIAQFSNVMEAVRGLAAAGAPVVGICNGFQILTEAGLLPGALRKNAGCRFICRRVGCSVVTNRSALTNSCDPGQILTLPINHYEGNFTCDPATLSRLSANEQIVLRYVENPNGSVGSIAGVCNEAGNVVGIMPHPERAASSLLGMVDGRFLLESLRQAVRLAPAV